MTSDNTTTNSDRDRQTSGGTISEGGSGALNADTAQGGADSVPDTPGTNNTAGPDHRDTDVAEAAPGAGEG